MSLKVPRGFTTISEDAIVNQYSAMRVKHVRQDMVARRRHENAQAWSKISGYAVKAAIAIAVLAAARPAWNFVQTFI